MLRVNDVEADKAAEVLNRATLSPVRSFKLTTLPLAKSLKSEPPLFTSRGLVAVPLPVMLLPVAVRNMLGLVMAVLPGVLARILPFVLRINITLALSAPALLLRVTFSEDVSARFAQPPVPPAIRALANKDTPATLPLATERAVLAPAFQPILPPFAVSISAGDIIEPVPMRSPLVVVRLRELPAPTSPLF